MCATRRCSTADSVKVVSAQKRTQSRTPLSPRLVFSETSIWVSPIKGNLKFRAIFSKNSVKGILQPGHERRYFTLHTRRDKTIFCDFKITEMCVHMALDVCMLYYKWKLLDSFGLLLEWILNCKLLLFSLCKELYFKHNYYLEVTFFQKYLLMKYL